MILASINSLRPLVELHNLHHRLWLKADESVNEFDQHFQGLLLRVHHHVPNFPLLFLLIPIVIELGVLLLERDGVVEEGLRRVSGSRWNSVLGDIQRQARRGVGGQEGNVISQCFRGDSGQSRKCVVHANGNPRVEPD